MKLYPKILMLVVFFTFTGNYIVFPQVNGFVSSTLAVNSKILNRNVKFTVYLPPTYSNRTKRFPVIYTLHGFGGDETSWLKRCSLAKIADSLIMNHSLPETIFVMPDGDNSYFINNYNDKNDYEDFFIKEFIPYIDSVYRTINKKTCRSICGLSMGGFGAIILAVKHPGLFGNCIALSAAVRTPEIFEALPQARYETYFGQVYGDSLKGEKRITKHWKQNSPYYIIDSTNSANLSTINWYIDCGFNDDLLASNEAFHQLLLKYNIPHNYHIRIGTHNWDYWDTGFINSMVYLGKILNEDTNK